MSSQEVKINISIRPFGNYTFVETLKEEKEVREEIMPLYIFPKTTNPPYMVYWVSL